MGGYPLFGENGVQAILGRFSKYCKPVLDTVLDNVYSLLTDAIIRPPPLNTPPMARVAGIG